MRMNTHTLSSSSLSKLKLLQGNAIVHFSVKELQVVKLYLDIPTWMLSDASSGQYMWINLVWALEQNKVLPTVAQQLKTVAVQFVCALPNANIPLNSSGFPVVL